MSKHSIYAVGGTVQASGGVYIRRQADEQLLKLCENGEFAYVLTARQMGKSSLMVRTSQELVKSSIRSVIIDLSQFGVHISPEQWYLGLLTTISDAFELKTDLLEWWERQAHLGLALRMVQFFERVVFAEVDSRIVVFIDEIDSTLGLSFTDDFYAAIRSMYNARATNSAFSRLSFVLLGVASPGDLISDPARTPFNIGQRVSLTDFVADETTPLADGLSLTSTHAREVLAWVLKWTDGHPYLTQRLCNIIAEDGKTVWTESDIDLIVANTFLGHASQQDANLQFVRDMLTKRAPKPVGVLDLLQVYLEIRQALRPVYDEEQSLLKSHLKLSGLVKNDANRLIVRNRVYAEVFDRHWVEEHFPQPTEQRSTLLQQRRSHSVAGLATALAIFLILIAFSIGQILPNNIQLTETSIALLGTNESIVTPIRTSTPVTPVVQALRDLTARIGPGSQYPVRLTVSANDQFMIVAISEDGGWYKVLLPDGSDGWLVASQALVSASGNLAGLPIASAPSVTPTKTLTPRPTQTPSPTLPAQLSCPGALPSRLQAGDQAVVRFDDPRPLNVRSGPDADFPRIGQIAAGSVFDVIDGPVCGGQIAWFLVTYGGGFEGWIAEGDEVYFVDPILNTASTTPTRHAPTNRLLSPDCQTILIEDEFTGGISENDWFQDLRPGTRSNERIIDDFYEIVLNQLPEGSDPEAVSWGTLRGHVFGDVRVEGVISASRFSPATSTHIALWVRYQDENNFIGVLINNLGEYRIARYQNGYTDLVAWTPSPAIRLGDGAYNTLRIDMTQSRITLYINGNYVTDTEDTTWSEGRIAFFGASTQVPASFLLDYFRVCAIGPIITPTADDE